MSEELAGHGELADFVEVGPPVPLSENPTIQATTMTLVELVDDQPVATLLFLFKDDGLGPMRLMLPRDVALELSTQLAEFIEQSYRGEIVWGNERTAE